MKDYQELVALILTIAFGLFLFGKPSVNKPTALKPVQIPVVAASQDLKSTGVLPESKAAAATILQVPILMYHHVGFVADSANGLDHDLTVSSEEFEQQVLYFEKVGYQPVTLQQVYEAAANGLALPEHAVAFTFDDGYEDVFVNAVPILQKYGFVGSFAIVPGFLGLKGYASWEQVIQAHIQGMEIVSHTMNHIDLTNRKYTADDLKTEVEGSKLILENRLGVPVDIFIYPYGKHDARAIEAVRQAGYKMAFTTDFGTKVNPDNLLFAPRIRVHGQDGLSKLKKIFEKIAHTGSSRLNP